MTSKPSSALAGFLLACLSLSFTSTFAEQAPKEEVPKPPFEEVYKKEEAALIALLKIDRVQATTEIERVAHKLIKEFPDEAKAYFLLEVFTSLSSDQDKIIQTLERLTSTKSKNLEVMKIADRAKSRLDRIKSLIDKPIELAFSSLDGKDIDLKKMKGKVILVDFWATWCGPCIEGIPEIKSVYNEFNSEGFEVIGISLDMDKSSLESFISENEMTWPQYFDGQQENLLALKFGVERIPAMWLVNKKGILVDLFAGGALKEKVEKYLAQ